METNRIFKVNTNIVTGTNTKLSFSIAAKDLSDCFYNVSGMMYNGEKIDSHIESIVVTNVSIIIPNWSDRELNPNYKDNEAEEE